MAAIFTAWFRVQDWKALQQDYRTRLVGLAACHGATSIRIYRNAQDAAEALILIHAPDAATAQTVMKLFEQALLLPFKTDNRIWEAMEWADETTNTIT